MSFRTRLFVATLLAILVPLGALAYGVGREMSRRLTAEYESRARSMVAAIKTDLARESASIAARLEALSTDLGRDNRFRLAALQRDPRARQYLLDYAGEAMSLSGLSLLQLQDSSGRILSSGHFRNEFDRRQPELPRILSRLGDTAVLVRTRTPESTLVALVRIDSLRVGGKRFTLVGGLEAESRVLGQMARPGDLSIGLVYPGQEVLISQGTRVLQQIHLPYLDLLGSSTLSVDSAGLLVTQSLATLNALRQSVNRWFLVALALTIGGAILVAAWLSSRVSRPLRELARKTSQIDLDRLDQSFETERRDEIGALSRLLGAMTDRLRVSSASLREAERRAAVGDLARQVTHDIKNGLAPIRNVLRHFSQVAQQDPQLLGGVFEERKGTLESSVEYLENLARNYDRLSPGLQRQPCDVNAIIEQVLRSTSRDGADVHAKLTGRLPLVRSDGLMLRRILENLVGNALDSAAGRSGASVTVSTEAACTGSEPPRVRITVADTGSGMSRAELDRAFDDFYTTKPGGTGLGLSIVRRLILDLNGSLRVETEPGAGTRVIVELPGSEGTHT